MATQNYLDAFYNAREQKDRSRREELSREQMRLQNRASEMDNSETFQRQARDLAGFEAGVDEYGPLAGSSAAATAAGQVAGIRQREQTFENDQTDRTEGRRLTALTRASEAVRAGTPLPDNFRNAIGLTVDDELELRQLAGADPAAFDAAMRGLMPEPDRPFEVGVDPATGREVFFARNQRDPLNPDIVENVRPTKRQTQGGSGSPAGWSESAPNVFRNNRMPGYWDAAGNRIPDDVALAAIREGSAAKTGGQTEGREQAKFDSPQAQRERIVGMENAIANSEIARRDGATALELLTNSPAFFNEDGSSKQSPVASARRIAASRVPGTDEHEVARAIRSLQDNIGIDQLLNIKREGSGLGQVPQSQLEQLNSLLGRLEVGRDPAILRRDIADAIARYDRIYNAARSELDELGRAPARLPSDTGGDAPVRRVWNPETGRLE